MKSLRIAVAGFGAIGRKHAEVLRACGACERVVIIDPEPRTRMQAESQRFDAFPDIGSGHRQAGFDAVVIAVPTADHLESASHCIELGLPILVEKPIADTVEAARLLSERADAAGIPLLIGHHRRHNPLVRTAAGLIGDGLIGRPTVATVLYTFKKPDAYFDIPWHREPNGGGPILINLIHEVDQLRFLLGEVRSVQAVQSNAVRGLPVEDSAVVLLRFASGVLATITLSDCVAAPWSYDLASGEFDLMSGKAGRIDRGREDTHFISGTEGSLTLPNLRHYSFAGEAGWSNPLAVRSVKPEAADTYVLQAEHFLRVAQGLEAPLVTGADATRTLEVTLAIKAAARTGQAIDL
ncbi:Gfo/Idh/MocA family protein [Azospirillum endophyticum]